MGKRMGALTAQKSCLHRIKFGNFGPLTQEFTVMVWRPFMREIVETRSILGTRIAGQSLKVGNKLELGLYLGRV